MSPTTEIPGVQHSFFVLDFVDWLIEMKVLIVS
jgi:hypothetical protein